MVLTLVVVTDEAAQYDAVRAATEAAREHPSPDRSVVIARDPEEPTRLDAEIRVGESAPGEVVLLRLYGELAEHADSVVSPLLLPDTPVVTWWPGDCPGIPAKDPIGMLAQRRITDARAAADSVDGDRRRGRAATCRVTPTWPGPGSRRGGSLLAATLDQPHGKVSGGTVEAERATRARPARGLARASASASRSKAPTSGGPGLTAVNCPRPSGDIDDHPRPTAAWRCCPARASRTAGSR